MREFRQSYDSWLQENDEAARDYYYAFQEAREHFLDSTCNPHDYDVFMDALTECDLDTDDLKAAIALGESGYEQIGKAIWEAVYYHCDSVAKQLAIAKLNQTKES